jgi:hypothetical protein
MRQCAYFHRFPLSTKNGGRLAKTARPERHTCLLHSPRDNHRSGQSHRRCHHDACLSEYRLLRNSGDKSRQKGDQRNYADENNCGSSFLFAHAFSTYTKIVTLLFRLLGEPAVPLTFPLNEHDTLKSLIARRCLKNNCNNVGARITRPIALVTDAGGEYPPLRCCRNSELRQGNPTYQCCRLTFQRTRRPSPACSTTNC